MMTMMRSPGVSVTIAVLALCLLAASVVWHSVQRGIARERTASATRAQTQRGTSRLGLHAIADSIARRRSARNSLPTPGAVAALLDQTARRCASGVSLGEAFAVAADGSAVRPSFADATEALAAGESVDRALERVPVDQPDVALAVHVLRLCASQGGAVSESLDRAAATLREREAVAGERVVQSAQARLSARVLTLLPIGFGGWTVLTTPTVQRFFLTPIGMACLVLGLSLNAGGWLLMRRVSRGQA